jgi:hypothetical protein
MICKCGGHTNNNVHNVKTLKVAKEWLPEIEESNLPLTVDNYVCQGCGRQDTNFTFKRCS